MAKGGSYTARKTNKYDHLYQQADEYVLFNEDDKVLRTIKYKLPSPPPLKEIEGYGLPPHRQKWERPQLPPKLAKVQAQEYVDLEEFWDDIDKDYDYYQDELWFIEREWERRRKGHWIFINGKPTWMTPWFYYYLAWFQMDNESGSKYADYRDRDRKFFLMAHYCATTTEAPFRYKITNKETGRVSYTSDKDRIKATDTSKNIIEPGDYLVNMGRRTVLGFNYPKLRREGATTKVHSILLEICSRSEQTKCGMQSMTDDNAYDLYNEHMVMGWKGMPFFFRPINTTNSSIKSGIKFESGKNSSRAGKKARRVFPLESEFLYGNSNVKYFDGQKLKGYQSDESGKTEIVDVYERHDVVKKCLSIGDGSSLIGIAFNTSTVEDMEKGGENFKRLCNDSQWENRDDTGQTLTGMINFFIPSDEGLENFIDEFGNSKKSEAFEHIDAKRNGYKAAEQYQKLVEHTRRAPLTFSEAFTSAAKNRRFNIAKLNDRKKDFLFNDNPFCRYGRLEWAGWKEHDYDLRRLPTLRDFVAGKTYVRFVEMDKNEKFGWELSYIPPPSIANKFYIDDFGIIRPKNSHLFTFGIDMYKVSETTSSGEGSKGAGAILRRLNLAIDNPKANPLEINPKTGDFMHVTNRFCGVYLDRPADKNEFKEQMLMAAIFFGCRAFPEINVPDVWDWFGDREFEGYLQHRIDKKTGKEIVTPGATTTSINSKPIIFNRWFHYVEDNIMRENHMIFIDQLLKIDDDMKEFDAFVAGGYALIADTEEAVDYRPEKEEVTERSVKYVEVFEH